MTTLLATVPRTPSPKVRIRSQSFSFDSPSSISRLGASTPLDDAPFSKSTGSINITKTVAQHHVLLPLKTKMSDESMSDASSTSSISVSSSPSTSEHEPSDTLHPDLPAGNLLGLFETTWAPKPSDALHSHPPPNKRARLSPSRTTQSPTDLPLEAGPTSPFAFQDLSFPMTSPWLVRTVLDLHDVHRVNWMNISDIIGRMYGVKTGSGEVLEILSGNGRVNRMWWD